LTSDYEPLSGAGFWGLDPDTGEEVFIYYQDLEDEIVQNFIKPVGGFVFPADLFTLSRLPDVPFYVKDWLPKRGKSVIYGPAKVGKSMLCLQISRCIGSAEPFLGIPTVKGSVLYIQFELGEEILQARLKQTGQGYPNVWVGTTFSLKLDTPAGQQQLLKALDAVLPNVLILDPWYKGILGDENEGVEMRRTFDFLDSIIEGYNCSILLIHHAGKDLTKRGRGSSVLEDWVDSYIEMKRASKAGENLRVKLRPIFLRHAPLPDEALEIELGTDFEFHLSKKDPKVKDAVAEFIKGKLGTPMPTVSPMQILEEDIGSNTSVYEALKELREEEKIEQVGRGRYQWRGNKED